MALPLVKGFLFFLGRKTVVSNTSPPKRQFNFKNCSSSNFIDNGDGTVTINLPRSFLDNARKHGNHLVLDTLLEAAFHLNMLKRKQ